MEASLVVVVVTNVMTLPFNIVAVVAKEVTAVTEVMSMEPRF